MHFFSNKRRALLTATVAGLLSVTLAACSKSELPFQGNDISGTGLGRDLGMVDPSGKTRSLADYKGKVVVAFFGFTHCPDVCPTAMAQLAQAMTLLKDDADKVQVIMITVDPERDTPEILGKYVQAFNPGFTGLTGSAEQLKKTAQSFKAYYAKSPGKTPGEYSMDHGSSFYILDQDGEARVLLRGDASAEAIASDIKLLL
ncbi:MAG TPA: SCO family protein [Eoetvoesiella sp.]